MLRQGDFVDGHGNVVFIPMGAFVNMPLNFRVISKISDEPDMCGTIHPCCVHISWIDTHGLPGCQNVRNAIFDSITGEYLTDCF